MSGKLYSIHMEVNIYPNDEPFNSYNQIYELCIQALERSRAPIGLIKVFKQFGFTALLCSDIKTELNDLGVTKYKGVVDGYGEFYLTTYEEGVIEDVSTLLYLQEGGKLRAHAWILLRAHHVKAGSFKRKLLDSCPIPPKVIVLEGP
ncbi:beta protein [Yata virus]|uniref:Beta protein n=1 Tax=Yata virus TaxID=1272960 RepID=A0A096ZGU6_9RHAB|nr:beta protein [Yata virus]AIR95577.1 beta protein [Yata virus]UUB88397.1 beta protein [Yata virus]